MTNSFTASYHQERIWFIDEFESGYLYEASPVYHNIPAIVEISGHVSPDLLRESLQFLVRRNSVLRTRFMSDGTHLFQQVSEECDFSLQAITLQPGQDIGTLIRDEIQVPFRLSEGGLLRALLITVSGQKQVLVITTHHAVADKQTVRLLLQELFANYRALAEGRTPQPEEAGLQYADYASWQKETYPEIRDHLLSYWKMKLSGRLQALDLPSDFPRAAIHVYRSVSHEFVLPAVVGDTLVAADESTIRLELLAAFQLLLHRYCRQEEIIIGISSLNRDEEALKEMPGPVSNLVPVRTFITGNESYNDLLRDLGQQLDESAAYSIPFDKLVLELKPEKDMSRTALFDVLFAYENEPVLIEPLGNIRLDVRETNLGWGKYDLNLLVTRKGNLFSGILVYNSLYYEASTVARMMSCYAYLLENLLANRALPVDELELLAAGERNALLDAARKKELRFPASKTLHELFAAQAEKTPQHTALRFNGQGMSYHELNTRSNQLAHFLLSRGLQQEAIVALELERSPEMIVAILAVLKAGGTYLPIDPAYPEERKSFMLADSEAPFLLVAGSHAPYAGTAGIIDITSQEIANCPVHNPGVSVDSEAKAYIIYTSGTTGKPKGAMISHRNVVSLLCHEPNAFDFNDADVWTMFHSYCFDFSVWEMYGALLNGGSLVIVPKETAKDAAAFASLLAAEKVTVLNQTPGAFRNLVNEELQARSKTLALRWVIFGGEALNPSMLAGWHDRYPHTRLVNMYGITETTVHVTFREINRQIIESGVSDIGIALPTLQTYVFDKNRKLVPRGVIGELYVGGEGVCKGYLRQDALTKEKFVENPYRAGERLYRSGDLVRQLPEGGLEYIGRADDQVKIRGFRIEPAEIQNQLLQHPKVREALVMARGENENRLLCAYFVAEEDIAASEFRAFLSGNLPEYMIPAYFVRIQKFPLTSNGKIDRKALPDPQLETREGRHAPANETEEAILAIWSEILQLPEEKISTTSDFFEIGGHSLRATILGTKIHKQFHVRVPLAELFKAPTIQAIAAFVRRATHEQYVTIPKAPQKAFYALSPAQKRLFILQQMDPASTGYNMPMLMPVPGYLQKEKLDMIFNALIKRHEGLRTSFRMNDGIPVQQVHPEVEFMIGQIHTTEAELEQLRGELLQPFRLDDAPLVRGWMIETETGKYLALDMHHIITDGVSQEILAKEFRALNAGERLPGNVLQYKDYSEWINAEEQQKKIRAQKEYWLNRFAGEIPVLTLPYDYKRSEKQEFIGARTRFEIGTDEYRALQRICKEQEATLYMCLLAAVSAWLSRLSGQEDIVVGSPVAARRHADLENVVGIMINTLALRTNPSGDKTFADFLKEVKEQSLAAFENQEYAFEDLVENISRNREAGRNPLFDVLFLLQNQSDSRHLDGAGADHIYGHRKSLAKFDISVVATELSDTILFDIDYSTQLFKAETINRFIKYLRSIIRAFCENLQVKIGDVEIISTDEKQELLETFNNTSLEYDRELTIPRLFETIAGKYPESVAVVYEDQSLTYRELNALANRFAEWLSSGKGIKPGDYVGVKQEKSAWIIVTILGILKAGAAYLPVDPAFPAERISYILDESGAKLLIDEALLQSFRAEQNEYSPENRSAAITSSSPAYAIYTSGSTGKPKGVVLRHGGVINLNNLFVQDFRVTPEDRILQFANFTFDASVYEIFMALLNGAVIHILPDHIRKDISRFIEFADKNRITMIILPPPYLVNIPNTAMNTLRLLVTGGSPTYPELVKKWIGKVAYVNAYGPTETTVCATCGLITDPDKISIGKPIPNMSVYILSPQQKLQPVGVAGEIYIGGDGLAAGYLNNGELTIRSFIPNPYKPGELMYRTGDLARWLPGGTIKYIGRNDNQVKVSGYRIELGEIENQLLAHPDIHDAVAIVRGNGENKSICAYYVSATEHQSNELRDYLGKKLPVYMLPSHFIRIDKIPLSSNGKPDKAALPEPVHKAAEFAAPGNELEEQLVKAWSEVLGIDKSSISTTSNFFELGGNSLKVIALNNLLRQLNINDDVVRLFSYPTIASFSASLVKEEQSADRETAIKQGRVVRRKQQEKRKL